MARIQYNKRIVGVDSATWANFQGVLSSVIGLGVAILHSAQNSVEVASQTGSLLSGLAFGLATGVISIIVLPLIYYALGWVVGYIQGFVFNVITESSRGVVLRIEDEK